jgi:hypothetical protein
MPPAFSTDRWLRATVNSSKALWRRAATRNEQHFVRHWLHLRGAARPALIAAGLGGERLAIL